MFIFVHYLGAYPDCIPCKFPCDKLQKSELVTVSHDILEEHFSPDDLIDCQSGKLLFQESIVLRPNQKVKQFYFVLESSHPTKKPILQGMHNNEKSLEVSLFYREEKKFITEEYKFSSKSEKITIDIYFAPKKLAKLALDSYAGCIGVRKID